MNNKIDVFKEKMEIESLPEIVIDNFEYYYNLLLRGEKGQIPENSIGAIEKLPHYSELNNDLLDAGQRIKSKSVIIKLNGGLGTSMGLSEAKSLLKVKGDNTFLDMIAKQVEVSKIPLILMNSFNTQTKSLQLLERYNNLNDEIPRDFLQHKIPKIDAKTFLPIEYDSNQTLEWCPPGHGEIYISLVTSGMLDILLSKNIEYAFISNSDNLGAVMDYRILGYFAKMGFQFLMEVASRTDADKKGGHLAKLGNGQLILRESAQCPIDDENEFQNIQKHKFFNTNNIWINLKELKRIMSENNNILGLPMIVNSKTVDPKDSSSPKVYQLETAMGSAISVFEGAGALEVPRSRFAPVKTTEDLLSVRSDNYTITDDFRVIQNPSRKLSTINIGLDPKYYKLVDDFEKRIKFIPSLVDCEELVIKGDFLIDKHMKFTGAVEFNNDSSVQKKMN